MYRGNGYSDSEPRLTGGMAVCEVRGRHKGDLGTEQGLCLRLLPYWRQTHTGKERRTDRKERARGVRNPNREPQKKPCRA